MIGSKRLIHRLQLLARWSLLLSISDILVGTAFWIGNTMPAASLLHVLPLASGALPVLRVGKRAEGGFVCLPDRLEAERYGILSHAHADPHPATRLDTRHGRVL